MKRRADLKILEIGQFALFKRNRPSQTTLIYTGNNLARVAGLDCRVFSFGLVPSLARSLSAGEWDVVFCHAPVRPLWDRRHGLPVALKELLPRLARTRTLGTGMLGALPVSPLVMLDFNDEPAIPAHVFHLLDRAMLYFKRELPTDLAKAFLDSTPRHRTHRAVMFSPFVRRNLTKLRPMSAGVPEDTVSQALATRSGKDVDVFFAGSINSTLRASGLPVLRSLQAEGYVVDVCEGGLSQSEYLARCARAWLTWSPEGYGWECFRHYEASLCLSVPVLSQPGIYRHHPLLDRRHAIYYPAEGQGLREAITAALADKPTLRVMSQAARAHALAYHTHDRMIDCMLDAAMAEIAARSASDGHAGGSGEP